MNYLYLAVIPLLLIIGGLVYNYVPSWNVSAILEPSHLVSSDSTKELNDLAEDEARELKRKQEDLERRQHEQQIKEAARLKKEKEDQEAQKKKDQEDQLRREEEERRREEIRLREAQHKAEQEIIQKQHRDQILPRLVRSVTMRPVPDNYKSLAAEFSDDSDAAFENNFTKGDDQIGDVAAFGIALLLTDAKEKRPGYLRTVEKLITRVDVGLQNVLNDTTRDLPYQNWYDISVLLARMLAIYEILGTDDQTKNFCHQKILQITPRFNESLGVTPTGIELAWIAVPRLITCNLYAKEELYDSAERLGEFDALKKFVKNGGNDVSEGTTDGFHADGSFIHRGVATYRPLLELEFHIGILQALGFETRRMEERAKGTVETIMHPSMNFVPFGLFGRAPAVTYQRAISPLWPGLFHGRTLRPYISPVTGLGVFKSDQFWLCVRVQRPYLAAYESDHQNFEFPGGWIQMRKMFKTGVRYPYDEGMTYEQLMNQPGVISFANPGNHFDRLKPVEGEKVRQHFPEVIESHIGLIDYVDRKFEEGRAIYWKQEYKFELLYGSNTVIKEYGVCTRNGVVTRHEIDNRSGKTLRFQVADSISDKNMVTLFYCPHFTRNNGSFSIVNNFRTVIFTKRVFNEEVEPKLVDYDGRNDSMMFRFGDRTFHVESVGGNHYHVLKVNSVPFIAGSYKIWEKTISYRDNGKDFIFHYDPVINMFKLK